MPFTPRISLSTNNAIYFVQIPDILYCQCNNSYTTFFLTNHKPIVVSRSIKQIEEQLLPYKFIRTHQSFLVNAEHVVEINKADNYSLRLSDNTNIPTSTRKRKELLQILQYK